MIFSHEITLDITLNEIKIINIKQYTKDSFVLHVNLTDRGEPFHADKNSLKCIFKMETPNQKYIYIDGDINEDGSVDISIPENACLTAGSGTAEVIFMDSRDDAIFATMNVSVNIVASAYNNSHITSSDDFDALHSALLAANKTYDYVMASANTSANAAKKSEDSAAASERNAAALANHAAASASNAASSANHAADSAGNAASSERNAASLALLAQSYAVGDTGLDGRENENEDCAKKYCENAGKAKEAAAASAQLAQSLAESFSGALRPMGTVPFAELPPIANASEGDMYNISDQFTTDNRFREGAGLTIPLGTNVYKTADNKWDILAGSPVTGVKGNAEDGYRKGNVNITPANIGSPSNEYMQEHFVEDYVTSVNAPVGSQGVGWYRIAKAEFSYYNSCVVSLKRTYNAPAPEYQKFQLINVYDKHKFVSLAACSESHIWTKIRETLDEEKTEAYIEIYLNYVSGNRDNYWRISIEDAVSPYGGAWKAITPVKTEETVSGVSVLASLDLPANFDLTYLAKKDGSNASGTWGINITGSAASATKATQDGEGNNIVDTYLPKTGGTITGNLRLKGSGNYGNILNFGDGDYVHLSEPTDDHLEIKGTYINFVTSNSDSGKFTLNGKDIALVEKIPNIQHGNKVVSSTPNALTDFSISFSKTFSSRPNVVITPFHGSNNTIELCKIKEISVSGFTAQFYTKVGLNVTIEWIAIGS